MYLKKIAYALIITICASGAAHAGCSISGTANSNGGGSVTVTCQIL